MKKKLQILLGRRAAAALILYEIARWSSEAWRLHRTAEARSTRLAR